MNNIFIYIDMADKNRLCYTKEIVQLIENIVNQVKFQKIEDLDKSVILFVWKMNKVLEQAWQDIKNYLRWKNNH